LRKVDSLWDRRKTVAARYTEAFRNLDAVITPFVKPDRESSWHLYVLRLNPELLKIERNQFIEEMKNRGVLTSVHFIPLYRHPYYRDILGCSSDGFSVSEWMYDRIVSLPIYPDMSDEDVQRVIQAVEDVVKKFGK
jgi:perosamine synthetase